jgi:xanthosine utilization system XapX-like protein
MALLPSYFIIEVAFAPLPQPFTQALRLIEIETAVDQASVFRLHFELSRNFLGDFDVLAIDIFRPLLPVRISIAALFGLPLCLINGFVREVKLGGRNDPGGSTLQVVGMDALGSLMGHIQTPFTWPVISDSAIAATIFGKYGIVPVIFPTPPTRTALDPFMIQRENDAAWLVRIARRNGFEAYIRPDPVIGLDQGYFLPPQTFLPPQAVLSFDFGSQTNLVSFDVSYDMLAPTTVLGVTTDPTTRLPVPALAPAATELPMGLEPTISRVLPPAVELYCGEGTNPAEVQVQALAQANRSGRAVRANGQVDAVKLARPLLAGLPVLVRGAGREHSGYYYITSVTHSISRDDYTQGFSAYRNAVSLTGAEIFIDPLAPAG